MGRLRIRFRELLQEKAAERGEDRLTLEQVSKETGLAKNTLAKWNKDQVERIDIPTLVTLCEYLHVTPGQMLELVD